MRNKVKFFVIVVICFSIFLSSIISGYKSYTNVYSNKKVEIIENTILFFVKQKKYQTFLNYTGLNTGYGFFAPNVLSSFLIVDTNYSNGISEKDYCNSFLKTQEGKLRFSGINNLYVKTVDNEKEKTISLNKKQNKYLDVILKILSKNKLQGQGIDSVTTKVYLYYFPSLNEYPNLQPKFMEIKEVKSYR